MCFFFPSKDLSTSSMCIIQLQVPLPFLSITLIYHLCTLSNHHYSQFTPIILPPNNFFATTIMESSNRNNFVSMKVEPNGFCVGVKCLEWCNNNNIVNRLKQDISSKVLFNVGIVLFRNVNIWSVLPNWQGMPVHSTKSTGVEWLIQLVNCSNRCAISTYCWWNM
jgi:hypothetical protein